MHAVVVNVTIHDTEAARAALRDQVVPRVSGSPGFVAAYWVDVGDGHGTSVAVFESEDAAKTAAKQARAAGDFVTFDSVKVGEVVANA
jgi:hypothetical protein